MRWVVGSKPFGLPVPLEGLGEALTEIGGGKETKVLHQAGGVADPAGGAEFRIFLAAQDVGAAGEAGEHFLASAHEPHGAWRKWYSEWATVELTGNLADNLAESEDFR